MPQGLAAIAEQKRKQAEAQAAASGTPPTAPTPPTKKGAIHPALGGLKKPTPASKYTPSKPQADAQKEESRKMAEDELRVRQRVMGK